MHNQQESLISFMRYSKEYNKALKDLHQFVLDNKDENPEKYASEVAQQYLHVSTRNLLQLYHKKYSR